MAFECYQPYPHAEAPAFWRIRGVLLPASTSGQDLKRKSRQVSKVMQQVSKGQVTMYPACLTQRHCTCTVVLDSSLFLNGKPSVDHDTAGSGALLQSSGHV